MSFSPRCFLSLSCVCLSVLSVSPQASSRAANNVAKNTSPFPQSALQLSRGLQRAPAPSAAGLGNLASSSSSSTSLSAGACSHLPQRDSHRSHAPTGCTDVPAKPPQQPFQWMDARSPCYANISVPSCIVCRVRAVLLTNCARAIRSLFVNILLSLTKPIL